MWAIRFLNGKSAGQEMPLREGNYILGRGEDCQITLSDPGISKKHAELEVTDKEVIIYDLQSSNGTFINGIQVQEGVLQKKDKVSLAQTIFDIVQMSDSQRAEHQQALSLSVAQGGHPANTTPSSTPNKHLALAGGHYGGASPAPIDSNAVAENFKNPEDKALTLKNWFKHYMDKVVLPGVYALPSWLEFKWVIAGFMVFFVVMMTFLSAFPLARILNDSVTQESMNHAESIAVTLARMNHETIKNQMYATASVEYALRRPGVAKAFIVDAVNGKILAPSEQAHTYSKMPFINEGRTKDTLFVKKIDSNTVAAMVPIQFYNTKTNTHRAEAYSVVVYDMGTLSVGSKRTLSLLVQTCFIALVLGLVIFFFLYKMIEFPIVSLNRQLSSALTDESLSVQTNYDFKPLKNLTDNINSALSRISASTSAEESTMNEYDRLTEMGHIIEMIGYPTLGVEMESMKIQAISSLFEQETGVSAERILNCSVEDLDDQALKLNLSNLLERVKQHPNEMANDSLEFSGVEFQLSAKGIYGKEGLAYTLISFIPAQAQEEAG